MPFQLFAPARISDIARLHRRYHLTDGSRRIGSSSWNGTSMSIAVSTRRISTFGAALLLLALGTAGAQSHLDESRSRFQRESDPVRKARALPPLGEEELALVRQHTKEANFVEALKVLNEYRDAVQTAFAALKASGINAEKKPSGFKELEIHLRKILRQLGDIITSMPFSEREPFDRVRKQLEATDKHLVDLLFPRQPGRHPESAKPAR